MTSPGTGRTPTGATPITRKERTRSRRSSSLTPRVVSGALTSADGAALTYQ